MKYILVPEIDRGALPERFVSIESDPSAEPLSDPVAPARRNPAR